MALTNLGAAAFNGRRIAVVGLGKSGLACIEALDAVTDAVIGAFDVDPSRLDALASFTLETAQSAEDNAALAEKVLDFAPDIVIPAPGIPEIGPLFSACADG